MKLNCSNRCQRGARAVLV